MTTEDNKEPLRRQARSRSNDSITTEKSEDARASRMALRAEKEQDAKRRAGRSRSNDSTPGASSVDSTDEPDDRKERMRSRAKHEQDAKRRGRPRSNDSTPGARSVDSTDEPDDRKERMRSRAKHEQDAKRRGRPTSDDSTPGAQSFGSSTDESDGRKERARHRSTREQAAKRRARSRSDDSENIVPGAHAATSSNDRAHRSKEARNRGNNTAEEALFPQEIHEQRTNLAEGGAANVRSSGTIELEAEVVDEEADMERMKEQIKADNHRLQIAMDQENERLHRQMEQDNEALRNQMEGITRGQEDAPDEGKFSNKCKMLVAVLFVLVAVGVGVYFGTRGTSSDSAPTPVAPQTTNSPTVGNGGAAPTPSPSLMVTEAPTQAPVYPRPSPEDCQAIATGGPVQGQEDMAIRSFDVEMDVALTVDTNLDDVLDAVGAKTQEILLPDLAGCFEDRRNLGEYIRGNRRNLNAPRRFAIANGGISVGEADTQSCQVNGGGACYSIAIALDLAVKSEEERILVVTSIIIDVFGVDNLVEVLGLGPPFDAINLIAVNSNTPTEVPSAFPTGMPSYSPTKVPTTDAPTKVPTTDAPTKMPTTSPPSPSPTNIPTSSPNPPPSECGQSCVGDAACKFDETEVEVGCDACLGQSACELMDGGSVADGSCQGMEACAYLIDVSIGPNSCLADLACACLENDRDVGANECQQKGDCCTTVGGPLNVPESSCRHLGQDTCKFASGPIGSNSCRGSTGTCDRSKATIGSSSCNDGGCQDSWGTIANDSCNGFAACPGDQDMKIGRNSCNCDSCCSCLEGNSEFINVPPDSCNSLAPNPEVIDYDINDSESGAVQHCCSAGDPARNDDDEPPPAEGDDDEA
jgi:hypothetical protein